jgi:hypothetical protein
MEPTGIEPVTSCLQRTRSRGRLQREKLVFYRGFLVTDLDAKISADVRRLSAIVAVSGTFGDECLEQSGERARKISAICAVSHPRVEPAVSVRAPRSCSRLHAVCTPPQSGN